MFLSEILVLKNSGPEGALVLFGLGMDNKVYYCHPMSPPDPAGWICIEGSLRTLQGNVNSSGSLELFGRGTEQDQGVWHSWQDESSSTGWHDWVSLGHPIDPPSFS